MHSPGDLSDRDVVLITLDSCRYDVAAAARLPHLSHLGRLIRAETPGTYTLPAHSALFNGFLPRPSEGVYPIGGRSLKAVWRSAAARPTREEVGILFSGCTLMDHYAHRGWRVLGAGGVTFFDSRDPINLLPTLFPEFHYYGRPARSTDRPTARALDRDETLTLAHVEELADHCLTAEKFFMFINCPSTHIPYTTPFTTLQPSTESLLERLYDLHDAKQATGGIPALSPTEIAFLKGMQRRALEWADEQLGRLFARLRPRKPLVVVCGDHGDEFGEDGRYGHAHPHSSVTTVPLWCGLLA